MCRQLSRLAHGGGEILGNVLAITLLAALISAGSEHYESFAGYWSELYSA